MEEAPEMEESRRIDFKDLQEDELPLANRLRTRPNISPVCFQSLQLIQNRSFKESMISNKTYSNREEKSDFDSAENQREKGSGEGGPDCRNFGRF